MNLPKYIVNFRIISLAGPPYRNVAPSWNGFRKKDVAPFNIPTSVRGKTKASAQIPALAEKDL